MWFTSFLHPDVKIFVEIMNDVTYKVKYDDEPEIIQEIDDDEPSKMMRFWIINQNFKIISRNRRWWAFEIDEILKYQSKF